MLNNQNIIIFGFADWDNPYKTNQHYVARYLSEGNRVLFVESLGLRQPVIQSKDIKRIWRRLLKGLRVFRRYKSNFFVYSPLVIPLHRYKIVRTINSYLLKFFLRFLVKKYQFNQPIVFSYIPNFLSIFPDFRYKLLIYHCVDEFSANPLIPESVVKSEEELLRKADITFVSSRTLYENKARLARKIFYLPNVADFEHFNRVTSEDIAQPADLISIPRPIVGFYGAISGYKIDFELLNYAARKLSEVSFVLIGALGEGEKAVDLKKELRSENIFYLGAKPYDILPVYLKHFAVCILPNRINEYTRYMFPLRFFEYLSLGKPVVAVNLPALQEFSDYFYPARDYEEFVRAIQKALGENNPDLSRRRTEIARQYSWEKRIEEISQIVEKELKTNARE